MQEARPCKHKKLACTCHPAARLLGVKGRHPVLFTGQPRNVHLECQMHLQVCLYIFLAARRRSGPDGVTRNFVQMLFSSLQLSFPETAPAKFICSRNFCINAGGRWQVGLGKAETFLHLTRWIRCSSNTPPPPPSMHSSEHAGRVLLRSISTC